MFLQVVSHSSYVLPACSCGWVAGNASWDWTVAAFLSSTCFWLQSRAAAAVCAVAVAVAVKLDGYAVLSNYTLSPPSNEEHLISISASPPNTCYQQLPLQGAERQGTTATSKHYSCSCRPPNITEHMISQSPWAEHYGAREFLTRTPRTITSAE